MAPKPAPFMPSGTNSTLAMRSLPRGARAAARGARSAGRCSPCSSRTSFVPGAPRRAASAAPSGRTPRRCSRGVPRRAWSVLERAPRPASCRAGTRRDARGAGRGSRIGRPDPFSLSHLGEDLGDRRRPRRTSPSRDRPRSRRGHPSSPSCRIPGGTRVVEGVAGVGSSYLRTPTTPTCSTARSVTMAPASAGNPARSRIGRRVAARSPTPASATGLRAGLGAHPTSASERGIVSASAGRLMRRIFAHRGSTMQSGVALREMSPPSDSVPTAPRRAAPPARRPDPPSC